MKILFLSHAQYITVGLPKIIEQGETLAEQGHDVTIVATSKRNRFKVEKFEKYGVKFIITPSLLWGKFRHGADIWDAIVRSVYLLLHFNFDIVHCIDSRPTVILPGVILKKIKKATLIIEWSDLYSDDGTISERSSLLYKYTLGKVESFFEKGFRNFGDGAVVITRFLKNKLIELGYSQDKILIHKMGGKVDRKKIIQKKEARKKLGINNEEIIIGHLGRIYKRDLKLLAESYKTAKSFYPKLKLYLIGNISNEERINIEGIVYTGFVNDEKYNHYCNAVDFFILPLHVSIANLARWPSKIGDYLSYGKPLISTKVSDVKEIFSEYEIGILSKEDNPESLSLSIRQAIESKMYDRWCENAFLFAKKELDWFKLNNDLIQFYKMVKYVF